jgi:DNA-binding XRE family transcriptional regulator/quercetin dioxygenase-like cupin family protein
MQLGMTNSPRTASIGWKLHRARKERHLSLRELAAKAEVSPSLLSQIENSKVNPSVLTLYALAAALAVPPSYFFDNHFPVSRGGDAQDPTAAPHHAGITTSTMGLEEHGSLPRLATLTERAAQFDNLTSPSPVVRSDSRARIELAGGVVWDRLTPSDEASVEFLEITYLVGGSSGDKPIRHSGREYGVVLNGTLVVQLGFQQYSLSPGDSIAFESSIPHRLVNAGDRPARAIWVVVNRQLPP